MDTRPRRPSPRPRPHRRRLSRIALAVVILAAQAALALPAVPAAAASVRTEDMMVSSGSGADAVQIDTTLYIPASATSSSPAPAIIVAHGFGGSKNSVRGFASRLAGVGYVTLAYSARGFGNSTGTISLDAPDYEIADVRSLIDMLAGRPEVMQDAPGDPRVGMFGRSYGGAVTLLTAAYDDRVDAIAPGSTWNSLVSSLFPNDVGAPPAGTPAAEPAPSDNGVFKKLWASLFFQSGGGTLPAPGQPASAGSCGNFRPEYCQAFLEAAAQGGLTPQLQSLLESSSPASVLDRITAPTLLSQGEGDTLFPLSEADATARGIAANGTPVKMIWYSGGHGARTTGADNKVQLEETSAWFDYYLRGTGSKPDTSFYYSMFQGPSTGNQAPNTTILKADSYPGLTGGDIPRTDLQLTGGAQQVLNPANGTPAALSAIPPGLQVDQGQERNSEQPMDIPDQTATFQTAALSSDLAIVGAPVLSVRVASPTGSAVLFGKLYDVAADGQSTLILGLTSPVHLTGLSATLADAKPVTITLPALAMNLPAGHKLQVGFASTDQIYQSPAEQQTYQLELASATLGVPQLSGSSAPAGGAGGGAGAARSGKLLLIGIAVAVVVVLVIVVVLVSRRRRPASAGRR